jgi:hypothetical protein
MIILKCYLKKQDVSVWSRFNWLRIEISGGLLWTRYWTFGFHKRSTISWSAERLLCPQEGLCSKLLAIFSQLIC